MFKKLEKLGQRIRDRHKPIQYNLKPYEKIAEEINQIELGALDDQALKKMSEELKHRAHKGTPLDDLLVEAFALSREVAGRVVQMVPYDVQVIAGIAIHQGKVAEMQTGEGKTLAAVMPAYLNALSGKGVHILTFNDYLAQRDAQWMGSIYEFLGLRTGYIKEGMSISERKKVYSLDVVYVTAKEAGFDYLRDFLCTDKEDLVHRPFHYAIVDEADSILIDEARIPLVIAGEVPGYHGESLDMSQVVRQLVLRQDYELDQNGNNIYLTDEGLTRVEEILGCGNLYEPHNLELLTKLNSALHAEALLERNKDYIVKNGKIEIIDEFTGRIAEKRHWPDNLQAAVEAKEGLRTESKGRILGSIALQHFLGCYPRIAGMTGTAYTASTEFKEFYGMDVVVVPTQKPCIRDDFPPLIYTHRQAKQKALVTEIERVHKTGQPLLIGTGSVEESERLAADLARKGIECRVLNAKNDEMEAKIIAKAGEFGAVTVSTNMAGRGVDIKLGGENGEDRERVVAVGGLYVIGTNYYESRRIDHQLRGRAGRQGDPGKTQFFISFEDDLMREHGIAKLIPAANDPGRQEAPVDDPVIQEGLERGRRIIEGYYSDIRRRLWKYSWIIEQQRQIIHAKRQEILMDLVALKLCAEKAPNRYAALLGEVGREVLEKVEKQITLHFINQCWAEYLDHMAYVQESIHLVVLGKKDPLDEFHMEAIEGFRRMREKIEHEVVRTFQTVQVNAEGIDMEREGLKGPSSTWTYLVSDSPDQFSQLPNMIKGASTAVKGTLFKTASVYDRILGRKKQQN